MNLEEEKTQIKYTIKDTKILRGQLKSKKITEPHANLLHSQREYKRKRENLTASLYLQ